MVAPVTRTVLVDDIGLIQSQRSKGRSHYLPNAKLKPSPKIIAAQVDERVESDSKSETHLCQRGSCMVHRDLIVRSLGGNAQLLD
jgi:hypothetical protein